MPLIVHDSRYMFSFKFLPQIYITLMFVVLVCSVQQCIQAGMQNEERMTKSECKMKIDCAGNDSKDAKLFLTYCSTVFSFVLSRPPINAK